MKITDSDMDMAQRFPLEADFHGFAKTAAMARLNPGQVQRLLQLGLIKASRRNNAMPSATAKPGRGSFLRLTDHYIRTFK